MIQKVYEVICDNCMELLVHAYTVKAARREMKKSGWRRFGDKDYCDKCIVENKV